MQEKVSYTSTDLQTLEWLAATKYYDQNWIGVGLKKV